LRKENEDKTIGKGKRFRRKRENSFLKRRGLVQVARRHLGTAGT